MEILALMEKLNDSGETRHYATVVGACALGIIISSRLHIALDCHGALETERQPQVFVSRLKKLCNRYLPDREFRVPYNLTQFINATLLTREEWLTSLIANGKADGEENRRLIPAAKFGQWLILGGVDLHF